MKRVLLLHTGGTLGMVGGRPDVLRPGPYGEALIERVPELKQLAEIELEILSNKDSSDLGPEDWIKMSQRVAAARGKFDGVVIVHGTDTMSYSASAVSFALSGLDFPVIFTGSQRPLSLVRSDARHNLIGAVEAATLPLCEVGIFFGDKLLRGVGSTKVEVRRYSAFESPNILPLAQAGLELEVAPHAKRLPRQYPFRLEARFEPKIGALRLIPGGQADWIVEATSGAKGVILEAFGAGNLPQREALSLLGVLESLRDRRVPVVIVSQAPRGGVDLSRYEGGVAAAALGAISGGVMTFEASATKLMWLLAQTQDPEAIRTRMQTDECGELGS
jgi:L-asparaginase